MDPRAFTAMAARPSVPPILTPASWDSSGGDQVHPSFSVFSTQIVWAGWTARGAAAHHGNAGWLLHITAMQQGRSGRMRHGRMCRAS